uniref:Uncharacterized protein n=1 Tax=Parascaris equorum TaxID=6256 RepID=A0A914R1T4_PAREQ
MGGSWMRNFYPLDGSYNAGSVKVAIIYIFLCKRKVTAVFPLRQFASLIVL